MPAATFRNEAAHANRGYADVNGVRLHYVSEGEGDLILFLHGFPEFWYGWERQLTDSAGTIAPSR